MIEIASGQARVIVERPDLLAGACRNKQERRITWAGLLAELGGYGTSGGSAGDYRVIVTAMAEIETQVKAN